MPGREWPMTVHRGTCQVHLVVDGGHVQAAVGIARHQGHARLRQAAGDGPAVGAGPRSRPASWPPARRRRGASRPSRRGPSYSAPGGTVSRLPRGYPFISLARGSARPMAASRGAEQLRLKRPSRVLRILYTAAQCQSSHGSGLLLQQGVFHRQGTGGGDEGVEPRRRTPGPCRGACGLHASRSRRAARPMPAARSSRSRSRPAAPTISDQRPRAWWRVGVHVPEAVLGRGESLREEQVPLVGGADLGDAPRGRGRPTPALAVRAGTGATSHRAGRPAGRPG